MTDSPVTKTAETVLAVAQVLREAGDSAYLPDVERALREAGLLVSGAPSERSPEFESLEQELFKHQPVLSMSDGAIAGCQCLDRVFTKTTEDWGTHLAEVFTALTAAGVTPPTPSEHECESCTECAQADGHNKCCGCYDGMCCKQPTPTAPVDRERDLQQSIDDLHEELKIARESRDAALEVMNQHKCGEQAERAYARAVQAESTLAGVGSPVPVQVDEWEYRVEYEAPGSLLLVTSEMETYERAEGFALENIHGGTVMRRRKAGPWQPVTEAERGGAQ